MSAFLAALFLTLAQAGPSTPTVEARSSTTNVSIGERFLVTVQAKGPTGTSWEFPKGVSDGSIELTPSRTAAASADTAVYDAQVFAIGKDARVPPIEIPYKLPGGSTGAVWRIQRSLSQNEMHDCERPDDNHGLRATRYARRCPRSHRFRAAALPNASQGDDLQGRELYRARSPA